MKLKERLEQLIDKNGELVMGKFRSIDDVFNDLRDKSDEYKKIDNISNIVNNLVEDIVKSFEQHEEEIRKQERQKVIQELEEWANTCYLVESIYEDVYCIDKDDLKQKLNEMKEV